MSSTPSTRNAAGDTLVWVTPKGTDWMRCAAPDCRRRGRHIPAILDRYQDGDTFCDLHRREMQAVWNEAAGRVGEEIGELPVAPDNRTGNPSRLAA